MKLYLTLLFTVAAAGVIWQWFAEKRSAAEMALEDVNMDNACAYAHWQVTVADAAVEKAHAATVASEERERQLAEEAARMEKEAPALEAAAERQFRLDVLERKRQWVEAAAARAGLK